MYIYTQRENWINLWRRNLSRRRKRMRVRSTTQPSVRHCTYCINNGNRFRVDSTRKGKFANGNDIHLESGFPMIVSSASRRRWQNTFETKLVDGKVGKWQWETEFPWRSLRRKNNRWLISWRISGNCDGFQGVQVRLGSPSVPLSTLNLSTQAIPSRASLTKRSHSGPWMQGT